MSAVTRSAPVGELRDKPGLADAGLAEDGDERARGGRGPSGRSAFSSKLELLLAADEPRAATRAARRGREPRATSKSAARDP